MVYFNFDKNDEDQTMFANSIPVAIITKVNGPNQTLSGKWAKHT